MRVNESRTEGNRFGLLCFTFTWGRESCSEQDEAAAAPCQQTDAERSDQLRGTDSKLLVSRHLVGRIKLIKPGDKQIGAFGKRVQELLMMSSLLFYIHKFQ